jgi:hypothetical protein
VSAGHTPAPWGVGIPYRNSDNGLWECHITRNGVSFIRVTGWTELQCLANARLVASASETVAERDRLKEQRDELLEAAKNALPFLRGLRDGLKENHPNYDGTLYEIRAIQALEAAITKAEAA